MNYNKLYYFYKVAQTLNFTKAANELYISQSAISRHMKDLESDFGTTLFQRTNRDLVLTNAGEALYHEIQLFYSKEQDLYQKVRAAASEKKLQLNIGFMGIQAAYHIPSIINKLVLDYPDLSIAMRRYNWDDILPALNSGEIDIGLRLRMGDLSNQDYDCHILDTTSPAMIVSSTHTLAKCGEAHLKDFQTDTFLMLSPKDSAIPYTYTQKLFSDSGFKPSRYAEYDQVETILMLIHSGAGVSLLSRFAAIDQFSDLYVVDLPEAAPLNLELIWKKSNINEMIPIFVQTMDECYES